MSSPSNTNTTDAAETPNSNSPARITAVADWLRLFIEPGQVTELRALGCTAAYRRPHTEAGFFDYDHLDKMAAEALRLTRVSKGVYWTINPLNPELISRRANRIDVADRETLTSDNDVIRRRLLLIDVDPQRPSGISSSDTEKQAARDKALGIRQWLHERGWPDPIFADSGNGWHLLYKIDLPRDDSDIIKRCLLVLASQFDDKQTQVDTSVFNPSRICKLYGTVAKKGDSTPDRPYRIARVLRSDGDVRIVDASLLESLAEQAAGIPSKRSGQSPSSPYPTLSATAEFATTETAGATRDIYKKNKRGQSVVDRARKYIARIDGAVQGNHGSDVTYRAAASLVDGFALSVDEAMPLMQEYNQRCEPPWTDIELRHKLESALSNIGEDRGRLLIDKKTADTIALQNTMVMPGAETAASTTTATATTSAAITATAQDPQQTSTENASLKFIQLCIGNDQGQTDRANGRRLAHKHGSEIRHCHPWKKWLIWDGRRWKVDDSGDIMRRAKDVADCLWNDAAEYAKENLIVGDALKPLFAFAKACASSSRLQSMVQLAASEPGVPIHPDKLDKDPWLINCTNGTVDLRTGMLRPHAQSDRITKLCPTHYNPDATCPEFDEFLKKIFNGNDSIIEYVQAIFGYCLTGSVREQVLPIFHGSGSNGKSTLISTLMDVIGPDYSMQAPTDLLMAKKTDSHPTEQASLFGMRLVASIETEDGRRLAESTVKQLTGSERIRARRMREDFWEFDPTHKILLATNHRPRIKGTDHAIWRRLALVPFDVRFWNPDKNEAGPDELMQDKQLPDRLKDEHPGILAWAVRGCLRWQREGLRAPEEVNAATNEYRGAEDLVGQFIEDRCMTGFPSYRVKAKSIYQAFRNWCESEGEYCPSQRVFGERLGASGEFERFRNNGYWWRGITMKETDESPDYSREATESNEMSDPFGDDTPF